MFTSTYTNLLQTLGTALVNSLWQGALVWLCFIAVSSFFHLSSSKKYLLSVTGELVIFCWFIVSFTGHFFNPFHSVSPTLVQHTPASSSLLRMEWFVQALPILSFVYIIVLMALLGRWGFHFYNTRKIYRQQLIPFENKWQQWVDEKARLLNIKKSIKVFVTNYIHVPLTIGIIRPVILLPAAVASYLTVEELESILLHEMAHIKRADYMVNILLSLVETVLYFNPFIFYFKRVIKKERENICDDEVLLQHYTPLQYAESLLKLAKFSLNKQEFAFAMSASSNQQQLLQRIQRITKTKAEQKKRFPFFIFFTIPVLAFAACLLLYIPRHQQAIQKKILTLHVAAPLQTLQHQGTGDKYDNTPPPANPKKSNYTTAAGNTGEKTLKADDNLDLAVENLKQITIPGLQDNIEEYRKNLSGNAALQLADNSLKQRIKNYVSAKNISINDFIRKVDSIKIIQDNYQPSSNGELNNNVVMPASYIEKDSLNEYISQHKQIKHFIVVPNNKEDAAPYYLIIRSTNENNEPLFIFIPYTPAQKAD
jgi:Antirepressor regulating drug resistance, predicted signal transduction N-terminal membrane component